MDKSKTAPDFIKLHPQDNIAVVCRPLSSGQSVVIEGKDIVIREDIPVGHKIAHIAVNNGDKIIKYGAPIGSAMTDIEPGGHIHLHNMKSDYIASHTRGAVEA